jgi:hypothetical protein
MLRGETAHLMLGGLPVVALVSLLGIAGAGDLADLR